MSDFESRLRSAMREESSALMAHPTMAEEMIVKGRRVRRQRRVAGGVAGLAVIAVVVPIWTTISDSGGSPRPVGPGPTITTPTTTRPSLPTSPPTSPRLPAWQQLPVETVDDGGDQAEVLDVRLGEHATYDRIVIDFKNRVGGYRIEQVPTLVRDGSGQVVRLPGAVNIAIRLTNSVAHNAQGASLYTGPQRAEYSMPVVRGVAFLGDFEGTVTVGLGIDHVTSVRVTTLSGPSRLVIDLQH